jgi:hypothetical protein
MRRNGARGHLGNDTRHVRQVPDRTHTKIVTPAELEGCAGRAIVSGCCPSLSRGLSISQRRRSVHIGRLIN